MNKNILLCGVGGQGTVLASKLISATAMQKDINVMSAETIGMAQKGGSVFSFIRMGENVHSPMFPKKSADLIIGFEPAEAVRMLDYLKDDGTVIVNTNPVMPVSAALTGAKYNAEEMISFLRSYVKNLIEIDGDNACKALGSYKVLNTVLLGVAVYSGALGFNADDIKQTIKKSVKPQFIDLNISALDYIANKEKTK